MTFITQFGTITTLSSLPDGSPSPKQIQPGLHSNTILNEKSSDIPGTRFLIERDNQGHVPGMPGRT